MRHLIHPYALNGLQGTLLRISGRKGDGRYGTGYWSIPNDWLIHTLYAGAQAKRGREMMGQRRNAIYRHPGDRRRRENFNPAMALILILVLVILLVLLLLILLV